MMSEFAEVNSMVEEYREMKGRCCQHIAYLNAWIAWVEAKNLLVIWTRRVFVKIVYVVRTALCCDAKIDL